MLPIGVEGSNTAVAGRLADLLTRLADLTDAVQGTRPVHEWLRLLQNAAATLFAVDPDSGWQQTRLSNLLEDLAAQAVIGSETCGVDPRPWPTSVISLGSNLQGTAGRADFFRGGVTISSPTPLRGIPYRVVCLLGMDESAFAAGSPNGDDLTTRRPPDWATATAGLTPRQSLLETVLAARQHLVVIRTGRSVVTNQPGTPPLWWWPNCSTWLRTPSIPQCANRSSPGSRSPIPARVSTSATSRWSAHRRSAPASTDRGASTLWPVLGPSRACHRGESRPFLATPPRRHHPGGDRLGRPARVPHQPRRDGFCAPSSRSVCPTTRPGTWANWSLPPLGPAVLLARRRGEISS